MFSKGVSEWFCTPQLENGFIEYNFHLACKDEKGKKHSSINNKDITISLIPDFYPPILVSVVPDKVYQQPNTKISVDIKDNSEIDEMKVFISPFGRSYSSEIYPKQLRTEFESFSQILGEHKYSVYWDDADNEEPGEYILEFEIKDEQGNINSKDYANIELLQPVVVSCEDTDTNKPDSFAVKGSVFLTFNNDVRNLWQEDFCDENNPTDGNDKEE